MESLILTLQKTNGGKPALAETDTMHSDMPSTAVETIIIVGAGFSHHAGLPLTAGFTEAMLEAREYESGPSRIMVDFLSKFIHDAFDHSVKASAKRWPDLEDIFTCVDLAANSGHHLGSTLSPGDLRTVRRAMLSRIIRMLDHKYESGRKKKGMEWRRLDDFFGCIDSRSVGFISMNWDTVIERKLQLNRPELLIDYGCDALPAGIPEPPNPDDFLHSKRAFLKERKKRQIIEVPLAPTEQQGEKTVVAKIHGSINWLYCDNCRRLFWFHPDQCKRIADQLLKEDDLRRIGMLLGRKKTYVDTTIKNLGERTQVKCPCAGIVPLGTRIATFSYRKALDFPMFQKSWFAAEELLRSARKWVFIGYSLPAADFEFKYLLKRIQLSRTTQPEFVVVSGGNPRDIRRTYDNYRKFFGRSIRKPGFFSSGLTQDAVTAICE